MKGTLLNIFTIMQLQKSYMMLGNQERLLFNLLYIDRLFPEILLNCGGFTNSKPSTPYTIKQGTSNGVLERRQKKIIHCRFSYAGTWELVNLFLNVGGKHNKILKSQETDRPWTDRAQQFASK